MSLDTYITTIENLFKESEELMAEGKELGSQADLKLSLLQDKIKKGERSSAPITDFVALYFGRIDADLKKPYYDVQNKANNNNGAQILFVQEYKHGFDSAGCIALGNHNPRTLEVDSQVTLCIINNNFELDIDNCEAVFPTKKYTTISDHESHWTVVNGPFRLKGTDISYLNQTLGPGKRNSLSVYVGKEVEDYFDNANVFQLSYVDALELLGEVPPEKYLLKDKQKKIQNIINELVILTNREDKLTQEIEQAYRHSFPLRGASVQSHEDSINIAESFEKERDQVHVDIRSYLSKAVSLGMHEMDEIIARRQGVMLNVKEYISGLCQKYRIDLIQN
ncbi:MAG: hypothetical protein HQM14_16145 [SAR324 cluster bacterium]|nr:hypothetical protein [SAR324 cluster bacterium]